MTTTSTRTTPAPTRVTPLYSALVGLCAVAVLLQGLWAGLFLRYDGERDASEGWITTHARGAEVALVLAIAATVVAFVKARDRKDLWVGSAVLVVLLIAESWIGGQIRDAGKDSLTAVHVPLAMALMGLVVWLPFRASRRT